MNVQLIPLDSKYENLAIMNISAVEKANGNKVFMRKKTKHPDRVYISSLFYQNKNKALGLAKEYRNNGTEVFVGGSGISNDWLLEPMLKPFPDYDLYPSSRSLGCTTRGCPRNCDFCIVKWKEGKYKRWMHVSEIHDPRFDSIELLDNNWYADADWFFDNSQWLIDHKIMCNAQQGMDIRLLTDEISEQLRKLKLSGCLHFAWDDMADENAVIDGIEMLKNAGFDPKNAHSREIKVYMLVDFNTTINEDMQRCDTLKELQITPYMMPYQKPSPDHPEPQRAPHIPHMARWVNREELFWSCTFWEYVDRLPIKEKVKITGEIENGIQHQQMATLGAYL